MAIRNWAAVLAIVDSVGTEAALSLPYVPADANTMPDRAKRYAIEYNIQRGKYGETLPEVPTSCTYRD
ncbi:hypothetical protein PGT2_g00001 [Escherichia phage PGT2]|uniref:Uncharacterized protein n=1 Tax=Escherichia phage PGT2 TaxID=2047782 RepID=A0A2D2W2Y6_9CAUD|nr:hypothetical protein HOS43_gp01 [Escherichia phage PGT2]ATS92419.1 hypothetical protein PGT2_g00001 [Escherichia phage PGT2]